MHTCTKCTAALVTAFALAAFPTASEAQISLEVRGGIQEPVGDFGDLADSDAGFGADLFVNVNPRVSFYGGWGIETFDEDIESRGFEIGTEFLITSPGDGILPWVRAGGILHELDLDGTESDRAVGLQVSVGADLPLGEVLSFNPAVRFQTYSPEFDGIIEPFDESVTFFSLDFALQARLGG